MRRRFRKKTVGWYEKYHWKKLRKILRQIYLNVYPPMFNPKRWRGKKANCYAYALDIPVSDPAKQIWNPGQIAAGEYDYAVYTSLTEEVKKDLDALGIHYRENSDTLHLGEWRIAIYWYPTFHDMPIGFHFARQDVTGIWSEKRGYSRWKKIEHCSEIASDTPPDLSKYDLHLDSVLILSKK